MSLETDIQLGQITETLNSKADVDGTNMIETLSSSSLDYFSGLCIGKWNAGISKSVNTTYTADKNGWLLINVAHGGTGLSASLYINNDLIRIWSENYTSYNWNQNFSIPISNGDKYNLTVSTGVGTLYFIPMKGVS